MDELFTRCMYYLRAKARNKDTTVEAVRKFFERAKYAHLIINIIDDKPVRFSRFKFDEQGTRSMFENYVFKNQRPITRSFITWYALTFDEQGPLSLGDNFQIEHIFPKKRQEMESSLKQESNLDSLGNKVLLEASINSRASDYRFEDKKKIYSGEVRRGRNRQPSKIAEIQELIERDHFEESDIIDREKLIFDRFFGFLREQGLLK